MSYFTTVVLCISYRFSFAKCDSSFIIFSAPSGQLSPSGIPINSTHVRLKWSLPTHPNGPVPPVYHLSRAHAALYFPPINAVTGAHFPGLGYYKLASNVILPGIETYVDFWFRTRHLHGLILFLASVTLDDFIAVEIRDGRPRLIFDCQKGVSLVTPKTSLEFSDYKWHFVRISRNKRAGKIIVDDKYSGEGESPVGASYIDKNTGVFIGGIGIGVKLNKHILNHVYSLNSSIGFIGCIRNLRLQNNIVNFQNATEKVNVDRVDSGCPLSSDAGFYLKGGGYLSLVKGVFDGNKIYSISFDFRTFYSSGLLMFVYAEGTGLESYLAVMLENRTVRVLYRTRNSNGNITVVPKRSICDGIWHKLSLTNFASSVFTLDIDGDTRTDMPISNLIVTSELYFGGLPSGSLAARKAGSIGLRTDFLFGGCFKNIQTNRRVNVLTELSSSMNVDFSGCPSNTKINGTGMDKCNNETEDLVYVGTLQDTVDGELAPFTG